MEDHINANSESKASGTDTHWNARTQASVCHMQRMLSKVLGNLQ